MTRMLEGTEIATIIAAVVTSLDNCINPKRTPRHRDDPRPNKKPRFILAALSNRSIYFSRSVLMK
jgi:hypothetical protein